MIGRTALVLVVIVSCAHALVHVFEHALPAVEQEIAAEYQPDEVEAGKQAMGRLSLAWRLPWGLGALLAGWLVDRFGAGRLLTIFLIGSGLGYLVLALTQVPLAGLGGGMLVMGSLAAIYHPAGLSLISHVTKPENRPMALGIHGVLGSAGTGASPFVAGMLLAGGFGWRAYFGTLAVPAVALGAVFLFRALSSRDESAEAETRAKAADSKAPPPDWIAFLLLTALALLQGFVYSGLFSFLPRYLSTATSGSNTSLPWLDFTGSEQVMTAWVLLLGCVGQFLAGGLARPKRLEVQLTYVTLANVPFLLWMAVAEDWRRLVAAGAFAIVHYMHQPLYNTLVAKYTPAARRSLCYGFSFAMALGVGGVGAVFAGYSSSDRATYGTLAVVATLAALLGVALSIRARR